MKDVEISQLKTTIKLFNNYTQTKTIITVQPLSVINEMHLEFSGDLVEDIKVDGLVCSLATLRAISRAYLILSCLI